MQLLEAYEGQTAIVVGGSGGIGSEVCSRLIQSGMNVIAVARHLNSDPALNNHPQFAALCCDITNSKAVEKLADMIDRNFETPSVLIHCAGTRNPGGIMDLTPELWRQAMSIHLDSVFYICKSMTPLLMARGHGSIVLTSSAAGRRPVADSLAYATAKSAIEHYTRCLARELATYNIRVNCIAPGFVATNFHKHTDPQELFKLKNQRVPLGRMADVSDICDMMISVIENAYLTGETILIDGGLNLGFSEEEAHLRRKHLQLLSNSQE